MGKALFVPMQAANAEKNKPDLSDKHCLSFPHMVY